MKGGVVGVGEEEEEEEEEEGAKFSLLGGACLS